MNENEGPFDARPENEGAERSSLFPSRLHEMLTEFALWSSPVLDRDNADDRAEAEKVAQEFLDETTWVEAG